MGAICRFVAVLRLLLLIFFTFFSFSPCGYFTTLQAILLSSIYLQYSIFLGHHDIIFFLTIAITRKIITPDFPLLSLQSFVHRKFYSLILDALVKFFSILFLPPETKRFSLSVPALLFLFLVSHALPSFLCSNSKFRRKNRMKF